MLMDPHQAVSDGVQTNLWKQISLYLLTLGILTICILILYPFLLAITGAIVFAVITQRPYNWLARKIRNPNTCAALALVLVILCIIIPGFFIGQDLVLGTASVIKFLRSDIPQQTVSGFFTKYPTIARDLQNITSNFDFQSTIRSIGAYIGGLLAGLVANSFRTVIQTVIMLFILFFLYRDRDMAVSFARSLLPLRDHETDELLENVRLTIYATAFGRLAIAGIQALLAGLSFWVLGVPNALLWTLATFIVAILPAVGVGIVWIPVALYLGFTGNWGKAALLAIWGTFVLSTIDNFLYPMLVGSKISQHTVTITLAMLGGVIVFGVSGLVLGPIAFTIATSLLDFWRRRTITSAEQLPTLANRL
jgi:predicted PurR-regulated permease PerM